MFIYLGMRKPHWVFTHMFGVTRLGGIPHMANPTKKGGECALRCIGKANDIVVFYMQNGERGKKGVELVLGRGGKCWRWGI